MNRIVPAVLSGLGIAYARGDFTKAGMAALSVLDLARMAIILIVFGLAAVLIVKTFDRLLGHGRRRRGRRVAVDRDARMAARRATVWSTDIGTSTAQRRANR